MRIYRYIEEAPTHTLVKIYRENHGEGEDLGEMDEAAVRKLIEGYEPKMGVEAAFMQLQYFGFVPLLKTGKQKPQA